MILFVKEYYQDKGKSKYFYTSENPTEDKKIFRCRRKSISYISLTFIIIYCSENKSLTYYLLIRGENPPRYSLYVNINKVNCVDNVNRVASNFRKAMNYIVELCHYINPYLPQDDDLVF